jgi:hypothetical protein
MRVQRISAALGVWLALAGSFPVRAQPARPPARVVLFDAEIPATTGGVAVIGTATLRKGKARHLLRVDVRLQAGGFSELDPLALIQSIRVNDTLNVFADPPGDAADGNLCTTDYGCVARASAWLDLDAAEEAHPQAFVGKPLEIEVRGRAESTEGRRLQILAELIRKK